MKSLDSNARRNIKFWILYLNIDKYFICFLWHVISCVLLNYFLLLWNLCPADFGLAKQKRPDCSKMNSVVGTILYSWWVLAKMIKLVTLDHTSYKTVALILELVNPWKNSAWMFSSLTSLNLPGFWICMRFNSSFRTTLGFFQTGTELDLSTSFEILNIFCLYHLCLLI